MSLKALETIKCPCGESFETEVYQSVTMEDDPELKDLILGGEFNMVKCTSCSNILYAERFVLFHDRAQELMAFVHPISLSQNRDRVEDEVKLTFEKLQEDLPPEDKLNYEPILLFGMDELCAVLNYDDEMEAESEIVGYLCKTLRLESKRISRSAARKRKIPLVLPLDPSKSKIFREQLIVGLEKILKENDHLTHYSAFLKEVQSDPNWKI